MLRPRIPWACGRRIHSLSWAGQGCWWGLRRGCLGPLVQSWTHHISQPHKAPRPLVAHDEAVFLWTSQGQRPAWVLMPRSRTASGPVLGLLPVSHGDSEAHGRSWLFTAAMGPRALPTERTWGDHRRNPALRGPHSSAWQPHRAAAERRFHRLVASGPAGSTPLCVAATELVSTAHLIPLLECLPRPRPPCCGPPHFRPWLWSCVCSRGQSRPDASWPHLLQGHSPGGQEGSCALILECGRPQEKCQGGARATFTVQNHPPQTPALGPGWPFPSLPLSWDRAKGPVAHLSF